MSSGGRTHTPGFTDQCAGPLHYGHHKMAESKGVEPSPHLRGGRFSKPVSAPRRLYSPRVPPRTLGMRGRRNKPTLDLQGSGPHRSGLGPLSGVGSELHSAIQLSKNCTYCDVEQAGVEPASSGCKPDVSPLALLPRIFRLLTRSRVSSF